MKNKEMKLLIEMIFKVVPTRMTFLVIVLCFFSVTCFSFARPLIIKNITDNGMLTNQFQIVLLFSGILVLLAVLEQFLEIVQSRLFSDLQNKIKSDLFGQVFQKLLHIKITYFVDKNSAEVINRLTTDVDMISLIADRGILFLLSYILRICSGIVGLFIISWKLAFVVIAIMPIKFIIVRYLAKRKKLITQMLIDNTKEFTAWFGDNINGIHEIKLWNLYRQKGITFKKKQDNVLKSNKENNMIDAYNIAWESVLEWALICSIYILGGWLVCRNELTIGSILAFLSYSGYVTGPITAIFNMNFIFAKIMPSVKRLHEFMNVEEEIQGNRVSTVDDFQCIYFSNVDFSYSEKPLLDNINFHVRKGEKIGIVGVNGSGKTTLLNLILRFIEPCHGKITIDNMDINEYDIMNYRNLFSVISQEVFLFQDTIRNNIDMLNMATEKEINSVCEICNSKTFIEKISDRYNSKVGKNGASLSGGERQKIAVARALVKDAPIIIMDEATSNFDMDSNLYFHHRILKEFSTKTIIIITHIQENLRGMDRIYRLKNSTLEEVTNNINY